MEILKYSLGIDVSKDKLDCCLSFSDRNSTIRLLGEKIFANSFVGFQKIISWVNSKRKLGIPIIVVAESTGVYYENLVHYLFDNSNYDISVLLPIKAKYYFKSLEVKSKTDKIDARLLSQFGLERRLTHWQPVSSNIRSIKQLNREYRDLKIFINRLKNRLHAKTHAYQVNAVIIKMLNQSIDLIESQCIQLEIELKHIIYHDPILNKKVDKICTIPGVGFMTAICVIAETNGFKLFTNSKQLCSYAGMDVKHNNSGSKTGKSTLSKKGNKYIRQALYMPALSASRKIPHLANFYQRINEKNKCKKIGLLAVSRKLLVLIYTLWCKDESFQIV